ncbi:MAG: hypothetical protein K9J37_11005 [Saprospiraceae bacterium]|nr:hypothetical protein [Saprospiraceae bacterium]MCF8250434.1 hypothetical protein [Saprospiraceae bacterium]MCF8280646.1 hypothetical protein [Bacteroidales bacterium]MCF8312191.1 hypothetical protein [Saprospiraceae bacterium]MCF8440532.1 hypothetical protein [Saprospiraceae bacterium]
MDSITIKPSEVFKTIQENLDVLREIDYQQLSAIEKDEMRKELLEVWDIVSSIKKRMDE